MWKKKKLIFEINYFLIFPKCDGWNWKTCNEMYEIPRTHKFDVTNTLLDMFNS